MPGPGVKIYEQVTGNTHNNAAVLPLGTDVSALPLMGFSSSPLFMYLIGDAFGGSSLLGAIRSSEALSNFLIESHK